MHQTRIKSTTLFKNVQASSGNSCSEAGVNSAKDEALDKALNKIDGRHLEGQSVQQGLFIPDTYQTEIQPHPNQGSY